MTRTSLQSHSVGKRWLWDVGTVGNVDCDSEYDRKI